MADTEETKTPQEPQQAQPQLEGGTYEIIRGRLLEHARDLRGRVERLNVARKDVFGAIETELTGSDRISTANNCLPRDMIAFGEHFIFGYNVFVGLRTSTTPDDVFSVYRWKDGAFHPEPLTVLSDPRFETDFQNLYKYYRKSRFAKFAVIGPHLFMAFCVSDDVGDVKTFKWLIRDDGLEYMDNRSDHEYVFPAQHEFEWRRVTHDMHRSGMHPHVSIDDRLFVETVGGDLTIKIEDNTQTGEGIYSEPVINPDQTLDDAEIHYAIVGNIILLKVRPYQENEFRYVVYNEKIKQAVRIDSIKDACVLLPDGHGLVFPKGYYLQTGEQKLFDSDMDDMIFEKHVSSPNGEDTMYVFYNRDSGTYVLLSYNLISQQIAAPMICNGYSRFDDGTVINFRADGQPQKHHVLQIWQTPYCGAEHAMTVQSESYLFKIGNKDIVRCMAECTELLNLVGKEDTFADLYVDIAKKAQDIRDAYFWVESQETFALSGPLKEIRSAAASAVDEFEKVVRTRRNTRGEVNRVAGEIRKLIRSIDYDSITDINEYVRLLTELRKMRGEVISLKDLRYSDTALIESLDGEVAAAADELSSRCVSFLLQPDSLSAYHARVEQQNRKVSELAKVVEARHLAEEVGETGGELEMLTEIVANLKIEDATQTTAIIDSISLIYQQLNQVKSALKNKTAELGAVEGKAEFNSQMKLIDQAATNYIDVCDTPGKCDEYLTRVMVQLETLEARFADFDEFVTQLADKRDGLYGAFETRKAQLVEKRNRRATALMTSGQRILKGIGNRVDAISDLNEINGYFASDLMIERLRETIDHLQGLGDNVKAEDLQSQLKSIHQDSVRQLKDRQALYEDGENVIRFGTHKFGVNKQALELTMLQREGEMLFHLTGTGFFEPVRDEAFLATRDVWDQEIVSENANVYRAEYLAMLMLSQIVSTPAARQEAAAGVTHENLLAQVREFMAPRYSEGYVKGVHDLDAAKILEALLAMHANVGLLRYAPQARAMGLLMWKCRRADDKLTHLGVEIAGLGQMRKFFDYHGQEQTYIRRLGAMIKEFNAQTVRWPWQYEAPAGEYLFHELAQGGGQVASATGTELFKEFTGFLHRKGDTERFGKALADVPAPADRFELARKWVCGFLAENPDPEAGEYVDEAAIMLLEPELKRNVIDSPTRRTLSGMVGSHPLIHQGEYQLDFCNFMYRMHEFQTDVVAKFEACQDAKKRLVDEFTEELRLSEFEPRVLTTFVRNRLIDKVYLQLIGDNLAKQIGTADQTSRTDRQGLLLLISPPGYGKTTLMEYIANRLGLIFMKVNGPSIGNSVTSLDPAEAGNAASREEIEKLNLAFEMGDNVMIYLDDIQHCNPELLQKFISLCDAQRRVEGVYKGKTRTCDLRGKRVCVVMAGNPYTESGEKFKIPDMLSNRADTYNIGDIVGDNYDVFIDSYVENCLTSNPILSTLANRSQADVYTVMQIADTGDKGDREFEGNYSPDELNEYVGTMKKLYTLRQIVLKVNQQYIKSAAQADEYRTEPPFLLQGSYRNMNRIASRTLPVMNDAELWTLILSSYEQDAQTLTSGAESNMLKFKELLGRLDETETRRWEEIKKTFNRNKLLGGHADDRMGQMMGQLNAFSAGLDSIRDAIVSGVGANQGDKADADRQAIAALQENFGQFGKGLSAIKTALETGAGKLVKQADPAGGRDQLQALGGEILQKLNDVITAVKQDGTLQHETAKRHEALTINDNAQSLVAVLEEQFKTMETWLKPVTKSSYARGAYLADLVGRFEAMAAGYQHLVTVLQTKHSDTVTTKKTPPTTKAKSPAQAKKTKKKTTKPE